MNINGTMINYYFHCKRQCYLFANRINLEDNAEDVRIGRVLHEIKSMDHNHTEVKLDNIVIDKITDKYVIELKKSDADITAARMQVLLYLDKLDKRGIKKEGKLVFYERNNKEKVDVILLNENSREELNQCLQEINKLLSLDVPPEPKVIKGCKKCAYYEFCYL